MTAVDLYSGSPRVLLVHGHEHERYALEDALLRRDWAVASFAGSSEALAAMRFENPDVVVVGACAAVGSLRACTRLSAAWPELPVVVLGDGGRGGGALAALRSGAFDWASVADTEAVAVAVGRALLHRGVRRHLRERLPVAATDDPAAAVLGASRSIQQLRASLRTVASSDGTVVITGETGTGKGLVAETLHRCGRRRDGPFVAVNCAAIPDGLAESMLFGHVKGAFTDAREARRGLLQRADGGTLLLDEIPHLPLATQAKLLRALESRTVRAVGAEREMPFDARILVATNRRLEAEVEAGLFRRDLFYRLAVFELPVPPLRVRGADVLLLARCFLESAALRMGKPVRGLTEIAAIRLLRHDWPGNVRELMNCIEAGVALARCDHVREDDLPRLLRARDPSSPLQPFEAFPLDALEQAYIEHVSTQERGNKTAASRVLGIDRKTLQRRGPPRPVDERALRWIRAGAARARLRGAG